MSRWFSATFDVVATVCLLGVLASVVLQVFFRYVGHMAVPWTEEATRYLGIWMVFTGSAAAVTRGSHIAVTVLVERFPERLRSLVERLNALAVLGFLLIVFLGGLQLIRLNWEQEAVTFPVSVAVLYVAVAVFAGVSLPVLASRLVSRRERKE